MHPILQFLLVMLGPWWYIFETLTYIPRTVINLVKKSQYSTFLSFEAFKYAWFAEFWGSVGPLIKEWAAPRVEPLIKQAHGVVIDIGPGSGEWINLFDKSKVTKIYGVEPNKDHHAKLRERIIQNGLSDIYEIVPVGVEDLDKIAQSKGENGWVRKGEADCIMTIQCLCSVPEPKAMIADLYSYLQSGGKWYAYEHVATHENRFLSSYQALLNILWPHCMGGCQMTRDTGKWLKEVGPWSNVELLKPEDEPSYNLLPHIMGVLTK